MKGQTMAKIILGTLSIGLVAVTGCRSVTSTSDAAQALLDEQIETGAWIVLADVSVPRFDGTAAVVKDQLHLFGGVNMNPHTPEGMDKAQAVDFHHITAFFCLYCPSKLCQLTRHRRSGIFFTTADLDLLAISLTKRRFHHTFPFDCDQPPTVDCDCQSC